MRHGATSKRAEVYYWSSANFYENGKDDFGFLKHDMNRMSIVSVVGGRCATRPRGGAEMPTREDIKSPLDDLNIL